MIDDQPEPPRRQPVGPSSSPRAGGEQRSAAVPQPYLTEVVADAAERAGVPTDRVQVRRAEAVQWRDGSLGCPEPGMMYTQAIVDGYRAELVAAGEEFDYRLDGRGNFRLCEQAFRAPPYTGDG